MIPVALAFLLSGVCPASAADLESSSLSLGDLGISTTEIQGDPVLQSQLETRTRMLKVHQILGIVTAIPMVLTFATGPGDGEERTGSNGVVRPAGGLSHSQVMTHEWLGIGTTALYVTTASLALLAPNPEHPKPRGASKIHRILAWIHAPLMIATPILGGIADKYRLKHSTAGPWGNAHRLAAGTLLVSYGAAITVMTINF